MITLMLLWMLSAQATFLRATDRWLSFQPDGGSFALVTPQSKSFAIWCDGAEHKGVLRAVGNLQADFERVTAAKPRLVTEAGKDVRIVVGSWDKSPLVRRLMKAAGIEAGVLEGKNEKFLITTLRAPLPESEEEILLIAGSDKRGTIYGIYELSARIGVSPWYWWMDVPAEQHDAIHIKRGVYTDGEPAVKYRGLFINDEWPCLGSWATAKFGEFNSKMYEHVYELLLRLKANFLWPAMWASAFYADDPMNSVLADEMGIIVGTSHHEPMARNHQEWVRKRKEYGAWDYASNREVIDRFFREGMERAASTEDLITIGMRGDGDAPMGGEEGKDHEYVARYKENMRLMEQIFKNQRRIIKEVTGKPAEKRPQVWAIYKEVQKYYDMGLRPPKDVIMLVCDDNWGNVRRLPDAEGRKHPGGWGMYYHVDYVGAPRNTKWLNVTPIQNLWEQMRLTYDYGVDKLWVLNVGDIKPMEYPITLFLDMAWNPRSYNADNLLEHTERFCAAQFGEEQAKEAMRIFNLYSKYSGRVTPEMLDRNTYNLETGEWKQVSDEFLKLEAEALRQYISLKPAYKDAYKQLILFPVQAMANLYEMYYAQAMNHKLYKENNPQANEWAERVERAFKRDAELCHDYNELMSGGKWKGIMTQKHIGYTSWNDDFPADVQPEVFRVADAGRLTGGYTFTGENGVVAIEAEHFHRAVDAADAAWKVIPHMGRTLSGVALMPYTAAVDNASLSYRMQLPAEQEWVDVHVVVKSTLAFSNVQGHRYSVAFEGGAEEVVNFNGDLNEEPANIYTKFYPTVARRVVEKKIRMRLPETNSGLHMLVLKPLEPGIVFEKIVVDYGGYKESYLFMNESPCRREP
ncbi:glycosyl hydrolase 115 family protein [Prevotella heparinolytica]|uniref:glycosyl hydrolase 115 family protein n=1 Tax=Prevotella heparinolytica TaxID=28113 RepID=UPI0029374725|nr:glycosyl hydrolase 115 family protein [Bacteroides heparinolyticus]